MVDNRAGAGAGADNLTSWSRVKMERLHIGVHNINFYDIDVYPKYLALII